VSTTSVNQRVPRLWRLDIHGHRTPMFYGIFCRTCDKDITDDLREDQEFHCDKCWAAREEAASILWALSKPEKREDEYWRIDLPSLLISAKLRRASRFCKIDNQDYVVVALAANEIWRSVLLRQPLHDKVCDCKAKVSSCGEYSLTSENRQDKASSVAIRLVTRLYWAVRSIIRSLLNRLGRPSSQ
jgi:hypothetical protein